MRWSSAIARSGLLAVVSAGLTALLALLGGSIAFFVRVRFGTADAQADFEPNLFMRRIGLPASLAVLVVTFCVALWLLRSSNARDSRASHPVSYPET